MNHAIDLVLIFANDKIHYVALIRYTQNEVRLNLNKAQWRLNKQLCIITINKKKRAGRGGQILGQLFPPFPMF